MQLPLNYSYLAKQGIIFLCWYLAKQVREDFTDMSLKSQMLKGILEGCILAVINDSPTYGYELYVKLAAKGMDSVSEGSIYPILLRLQKEGLIIGKMQKSASGPNRKYYTLTDDGKMALVQFTAEWSKLGASVNLIIKGGINSDDCQGND
jgi:PadR family transcriptional regulator, regulatory protein PadR